MARLDPRNSSRYWQAPDIPGMSLLHADFTTHDYAPHVHEAFVVAVTEIGGSEFKSRGESGEAHARALLVFNPAEPHSGRMGGSARWRYRSFYLAESGISDVLQLLGTDQARYFTSNVFHDQDLLSRFLELHRVLDGQRHDAAHDALLNKAIGLTPHAYLTQLRLKAAIRNLRAGRAVAEAAVAAGFYDQSALNNHFKRAFGMTPQQFVRATRGQ